MCYNRFRVIDMNKKALISGASRGIGAAAARRLAADGWEVWVNYSASREKAETLAAQIGGRAIQADVADAAQVKAMFEQTGPVGLLVCCAGVSEYGLLTDMTSESWRRLFAVNVDGAFHCCREAIGGMVHEKSGCIILTSSVWGVYGASCEAAYAASKGAVIALGRSLAKELGPSGIRVNCVAPGVIDTDMVQVLGSEVLRDLAEQTPLGRLGTPQDIANAVAFLVSEKASFITGQVLTVDGAFVG